MSYDPYQHLNRIIQLFDLRRFDVAEKELCELLNQEPNFALGHAYMARCLETLGAVQRGKKGIDQMLREAQAGVSLDPENDYCLYILAHCQGTAGRYRQGIEAIDKALEIQPEDAWYHYEKGFLLYRSERLRQARECFFKALEFDPEHYDSLRLLAWVESQVGNKELAIQYADRALQINPEDADIHTAKGFAMMGNRPPEEVFHVFLQAVRLNPSNEQARHGLQRVHTDVWFLPRFGAHFKMLFRRIPNWIRFSFLPLTVVSILLMSIFWDRNDWVVVASVPLFLCGLFMSLCVLVTDRRALVNPISRRGSTATFRIKDVLALIFLAGFAILWMMSFILTSGQSDLWCINYFCFGTPLLFLSGSASFIFESRKERLFSFAAFVFTILFILFNVIFEAVESLGYAFGPMLLGYILLANRFSKAEGRKQLFPGKP